jgi:hypothetical protein
MATVWNFEDIYDQFWHMNKGKSVSGHVYGGT